MTTEVHDPYFDNKTAEARLYQEYLTHKRLIIAFDFDDTVFDYHQKGYHYSQVIQLLLECQAIGFFLVLFTGCTPAKYPDHLDYLKKLGLHPHSINKNPIPLPFGNDGKIYFNILLDDRAGLYQACQILKATLRRIKATPNT